MNEYVVINNLDHSPRDKYIKGDLPLHVTLSNTFYSEKDAEYFISPLQELANRHTAFIVTTKSREIFGDENKSVTEIDKTEKLQKLHSDIINTFIIYIKLKKPEYAHENYRPHITDQSTGKIDIGAKIQISNLTLLQVVGNDVLVKAVVYLHQ